MNYYYTGYKREMPIVELLSAYGVIYRLERQTLRIFRNGILLRGDVNIKTALESRALTSNTLSVSS